MESQYTQGKFDRASKPSQESPFEQPRAGLSNKAPLLGEEGKAGMPNAAQLGSLGGPEFATSLAGEIAQKDIRSDRQFEGQPLATLDAAEQVKKDMSQQWNIIAGQQRKQQERQEGSLGLGRGAPGSLDNRDQGDLKLDWSADFKGQKKSEYQPPAEHVRGDQYPRPYSGVMDIGTGAVGVALSSDEQRLPWSQRKSLLQEGSVTLFELERAPSSPMAQRNKRKAQVMQLKAQDRPKLDKAGDALREGAAKIRRTASGAGEKLKQSARSAAATAGGLFGRAQAGAKQLGAKIGDKLSDAKEDAKEGAFEAKQGAQQAGARAGDALQSAKDGAQEAAARAGEVLRRASEGAKEGAHDLAAGAERKAEQLKEGAERKADELGVRERLQHMRDVTAAKASDIAQRAKELPQQAAAKLQDAKEGAVDAAYRAKEGAVDAAHWAKEGAADAAYRAKEGAKDTAFRAKEGIKDAAHRAKEAVVGPDVAPVSGELLEERISYQPVLQEVPLSGADAGAAERGTAGGPGLLDRARHAAGSAAQRVSDALEGAAPQQGFTATAVHKVSAALDRVAGTLFGKDSAPQEQQQQQQQRSFGDAQTEGHQGAFPQQGSWRSGDTLGKAPAAQGGLPADTYGAGQGVTDRGRDKAA